MHHTVAHLAPSACYVCTLSSLTLPLSALNTQVGTILSGTDEEAPPGAARRLNTDEGYRERSS